MSYRVIGGLHGTTEMHTLARSGSSGPINLSRRKDGTNRFGTRPNGSNTALDFIFLPRERRFQPREHWRSRHQEEARLCGKQLYEDEGDAKSGSIRRSRTSAGELTTKSQLTKERRGRTVQLVLGVDQGITGGQWRCHNRCVFTMLDSVVRSRCGRNGGQPIQIRSRAVSTKTGRMFAGIHACSK